MKGDMCMYKKINVAIVGYGNIGRFALHSVLASSDMILKGVVEVSLPDPIPPEAADVRFVKDIVELGRVDVVLLCIPSRSVPEEAPKYLARGICTVDCFDIHGQEIWELKSSLDKVARENDTAAIISAGWDPGSNSLIRGVMRLMVPWGVTFTNSGPGMSMGHSVAARAIPGVEDAVSITIPLGTSLHRRLVYVKLREGADFSKVEAAIKKDSYFCTSETHVFKVDDLEDYKDMGHGVLIEHKGRSGITHNQLLQYSHKVNNPALTGQVMTSAARAVVKQRPGCYSMLEVPVIDYLNIPLEEAIKSMV